MKVSPAKQSFTPFAHPYLLTQPVVLGNAYSMGDLNSANNDQAASTQARKSVLRTPANTFGANQLNAKADTYLGSKQAKLGANGKDKERGSQTPFSSLAGPHAMKANSNQTPLSSDTVSNHSLSANPLAPSSLSSSKSQSEEELPTPLMAMLGIKSKSIDVRQISCASFFITGMLLMFYLLHLA